MGLPRRAHGRRTRLTRGPELQTERLLLRRWRERDREPFAAMNADPEVMRHFPAPLDRAGSDRLVDVIEGRFEHDGFGLWAVEPLTGDDAGRFAGFAGLTPAPDQMPFSPAVEVGWRLSCWSWGRGYATEAGLASLAFAFGDLVMEEIVSFTTTTNDRSMAVMGRLGMSRDPKDDFEHPLIPDGHRLRPHVLYRIAAPSR